jgi:hypothetical protein
VCTYQTERIAVEGSGKGPAGWFALTSASVYFDHPVHARPDHTLNIDFLDQGAGPGARVAVELGRQAAAELAAAIVRILESTPEM